MRGKGEDYARLCSASRTGDSLNEHWPLTDVRRLRLAMGMPFHHGPDPANRRAIICLSGSRKVLQCPELRVNRRCALALVLIGVFAFLTPLAYASPADAGWIAGVWDAADYDDVIDLIDMMELLLHTGTAIERAHEWTVNCPRDAAGILPVLTFLPNNVSLGVCSVRGPPNNFRAKPTSLSPPCIPSPPVYIALSRSGLDSDKPDNTESAAARDTFASWSIVNNRGQWMVQVASGRARSVTRIKVCTASCVSIPPSIFPWSTPSTGTARSA